MSKTNLKVSSKVPTVLILGGMLVFILGFLFKEKYLNCLLVEPILCLKSSKYTSPTGQFTFRYPKGYPLTFKTGEDMMNQYNFDDKYDEWVNFSTEFYPNAGGDRLGSVIVIKNSDLKSIQEYANKIEEDFNNLPDRYKGNPPKIELLKISTKDAVHITTSQQPSSFDPPSDEYVLVEGGKFYRISFQFNDYYHKESGKYYEDRKRIILSTFTLN